MRAESTAAMAQAIARLRICTAAPRGARRGAVWNRASRNAVAWIEDHSGGHDRAEERSATNLIDSGHEFGAHGPSPPFNLSVQRSFFRSRNLAAEAET